MRYDAIVAGVGGMGSAAVYHLARRGKRVLGLERFDVPHEQGSSHGVTRIIRLAYYEHPSYVPLLKRAYELWRALQDAAGEQLLHITGSIDAGPPDSEVVKGSIHSCLLHDLPHEVLPSAEITRRYPGYRLPGGHVGVFQPEGGFLLPERCIVQHVWQAQALGAEVHAREQVLDWAPTPSGDGVRVRTDRATYETDHLIVTAGAWVGKLIGRLAGLAVPERQVLAWLQPRLREHFALDRFPVFNLLVDEGRFYGFPEFAVPGFKIGLYHHLGERVDPDRPRREPDARDEAALRGFAERYFPDGAGATMSLRTCLFTNTPDEHFVVDRHPQYPAVTIVSPCSGHGFKFASVIGEIAADLALHAKTRHDIGLFRLSRFTRP